MNTTFITIIRAASITVALILSLQLQTVKAQTILFQQNFEISPVTNILNNWGGETQLPDGPSACCKASRGNTTDFNSTHIDFKNSQNPTYFLGVNPESPCGGYYSATVITDSLDFSGVVTLIFRCRYYMTNTLAWGPTDITVTLANATTSYDIHSQFSTINNWDTVHVTVPPSIISNKVMVSIHINAGEGVGIDDIKIIGYNTTSIYDQHDPGSKINIFPNPASGKLNIDLNNVRSEVAVSIVDLQGKIVFQDRFRQAGKVIMDLSSIPDGVYFVRINDAADNPAYYRIVKN